MKYIVQVIDLGQPSEGWKEIGMVEIPDEAGMWEAIGAILARRLGSRAAVDWRRWTEPRVPSADSPATGRGVELRFRGPHGSPCEQVLIEFVGLPAGEVERWVPDEDLWGVLRTVEGVLVRAFGADE